jgi:DNA-binding response OmpR family regulator
MGNVLIIDDDPVSRTLVEEVLHAAGNETVSSGEPQRVMELLSTSAFDAVVLDVVMPGANGFEVLRRIRKSPALRSLPVVMLSAKGDSEDRVKGLREGADDYVVKPFDPSMLVARVERLIARNVASSPTLSGRLETFGIADLLQNLERSSKSGILRVVTTAGEAVVRFLEGEIRTASLRNLEGSEALLALLEKTSGLFSFEPFTELPAPAALESIPLQPILLDGAWLEDELSRREGSLPSETLPLEGVALAVSTPEDLEELHLPLDAVHRRLKERPHTLLELLELDLGAPRKIRLAVSLLSEMGALVESVEGAATPEETGVAPDGEAVEELRKTFASVRGLRPEESAQVAEHCLIFYGPGVWQELLAMIEAIPRSLFVADPARLLNQLELRKSGTVRLFDPLGEMHLHIYPLVSKKKREDFFLTFMTGVVVWLGEEEPIEALRDIARFLATNSRPLGVIREEQGVTRGLKEALAEVALLQLTREKPAGLSDLLGVLPGVR